jgi:hypothetical protein
VLTAPALPRRREGVCILNQCASNLLETALHSAPCVTTCCTLQLDALACFAKGTLKVLQGPSR